MVYPRARIHSYIRGCVYSQGCWASTSRAPRHVVGLYTPQLWNEAPGNARGALAKSSSLRRAITDHIVAKGHHFEAQPLPRQHAYLMAESAYAGHDTATTKSRDIPPTTRVNGAGERQRALHLHLHLHPDAVQPPGILLQRGEPAGSPGNTAQARVRVGPVVCGRRSRGVDKGAGAARRGQGGHCISHTLSVQSDTLRLQSDTARSAWESRTRIATYLHVRSSTTARFYRLLHLAAPTSLRRPASSTLRGCLHGWRESISSVCQRHATP